MLSGKLAPGSLMVYIIYIDSFSEVNDMAKKEYITAGHIQDLIDRGALFVVSHSGGKDSQAMFIRLRKIIPADQLLVVHAHLRGVDWDGIEDHILETIGATPFEVVHAKKSFMEMVRHRGMFPSPSMRQCTSDLKRGPIEKAIRQAVKDRDNKLIVSCVGIRAEESTSRAKAEVFKYSKKNSKAGREWYEWLPIHDMLEGEVFASIKQAGEKPHWAYAAGMSRLSCCFCIMSSLKDLQTAARLKPDLYAEIVDLEKEVGHTMMMPRKGQAPRGLEEITGVPVMWHGGH